MVQQLLAKLKQRFSNRPNFLQTDSGTITLPFQSINSHWIIARGKCMFRCKSFEHVPKSKRDGALANQVELWSPFDKTGHHCVWSDATAMVWFWDAALISAQQQPMHLDSESEPDRHLLVRPETVFHARRSNGVYLLDCADGCELQFWTNDILLDSAWFPSRPAAQTIAGFLERNGVGNAEVERSTDAELLAEPWSTKPTVEEWLLFNERHLVAGMLLFISAIIVFQEVRIWRVGATVERIESQFESLQTEVGPVLSTRNEAHRLRSRNQLLTRLLSTPSQALLMSEVDVALPNSTAEFREWHFQQGKLRIIIEDSKANSIEYVRSLDDNPLFDDVRAEQARGRDRIELNMTVNSPP